MIDFKKEIHKTVLEKAHKNDFRCLDFLYKTTQDPKLILTELYKNKDVNDQLP